MTYKELFKKISKILTPNTDNFWINILECGFLSVEENDCLKGTGDRGVAAYGVDIDELLCLEANLQEKILVLMENEYKEEEYDRLGADRDCLKYYLYLYEHPFVNSKLWTGDMYYEYAYVVDINKEEYFLVSKWVNQPLPSERRMDYADTYHECIYYKLLKERFGIEKEIEQDYLRLVRGAAKLAYTIACFKEEEIYNDKEAQKEYMQIEKEFIDDLSNFHKSVISLKGCSSAYHLLCESATANYELAIVISTIGALEKRAIGSPYDFYWERKKAEWKKRKNNEMAETRKVVLDEFLDAAQQFNEEFKEEIEKEKEEYLKKQGMDK